MTTPSFPSSPATNDTVVRGDTTYKFNGYAWIPQSTGGSTSIFRVFYEVDFTAQTAQTVTGTTTLQGTSFFATLPSGSSISIGAYGLRMQSSSTPECNFGLLAGELPGLVGVKNLLRAKFAQWMHYGGYTLPATGTPFWFWGQTSQYPDHGLLLVRGRNGGGVSGLPNTSDGGLAIQRWHGASNIHSRIVTNALYNVFAVIWHDVRHATVLAGNWSSGWPDIDTMTVLGDVTYVDATDAGASSINTTPLMTPEQWSPYWAVYEPGCILEVKRYRVTSA